MKLMSYNIQNPYQRDRMLSDALLQFARQCLAEGIEPDQMEKRLIAMFRLKLEVAMNQRETSN
jgi:hypothetical protein